MIAIQNLPSLLSVLSYYPTLIFQKPKTNSCLSHVLLFSSSKAPSVWHMCVIQFDAIHAEKSIEAARMWQPDQAVHDREEKQT